MRENVEQYNGVPQVQTNNIQNQQQQNQQYMNAQQQQQQQQYQLIPRAVIMRLQEAGYLPLTQVQVNYLSRFSIQKYFLKF